MNHGMALRSIHLLGDMGSTIQIMVRCRGWSLSLPQEPCSRWSMAFCFLGSYEAGTTRFLGTRPTSLRNTAPGGAKCPAPFYAVGGAVLNLRGSRWLFKPWSAALVLLPRALQQHPLACSFVTGGRRGNEERSYRLKRSKSTQIMQEEGKDRVGAPRNGCHQQRGCRPSQHELVTRTGLEPDRAD